MGPAIRYIRKPLILLDEIDAVADVADVADAREAVATTGDMALALTCSNLSAAVGPSSTTRTSPAGARRRCPELPWRWCARSASSVGQHRVTADEAVDQVRAGERCALLRRRLPARRAAVEIGGKRYHDDDACAGEIRRRMAAGEAALMALAAIPTARAWPGATRRRSRPGSPAPRRTRSPR